MPQERELIERAKRGDRAAISELYHRHADAIYRYIHLRVKDPLLAEDLTAEVFLKMLEGLSGYRYTRAPFVAWLYRIAHAHTVDHWRQTSRRPVVTLPETQATREGSPEAMITACTEQTELATALADLSDEQADAIMLAENVHRVDLNPLDEAKAYDKRMDRHGWSVAQVADAAHVTTRRVANRLKLLALVPEAQDLIACGQMGVKWGEVMSQLEPHYQRKAMQYLVTTERPLLREFEALCGELLVKQAQLAMFSADDLWIEQVLEDHNAAREERYEQVFPSDERLPVMRKVKNVGLSFETYIAQLLASDDPYHQRAAAIVGRVYEGMLAGGMAFPPREGSPLRS